MDNEFFDAMFIYKDEDGKQHQEKHHVKSFDKVLTILFNMQEAKINLLKIRIYDFFGTKMKELYVKEDFILIPGYDAFKTARNRDKVIESLEIC